MVRALVEALIFIVVGLLFLPLVASFAGAEAKDKNLSAVAQQAVSTLPVIYVILLIIGAFAYIRYKGK